MNRVVYERWQKDNFILSLVKSATKITINQSLKERSEQTALEAL